MSTNNQSSNNRPVKGKAAWNWQPPDPVANNPLFSWPPNALKVLHWYGKSWQPVSEYGLLVALALLSWFYLSNQPFVEITRHLSWDWTLTIYGRNLIYTLILAGGLHLYFHTYEKQGGIKRYDGRKLGSGGRFNFGHQNWDNLFWSRGLLTTGFYHCWWRFYRPARPEGVKFSRSKRATDNADGRQKRPSLSG